MESQKMFIENEGKYLSEEQKKYVLEYVYTRAPSAVSESKLGSNINLDKLDADIIKALYTLIRDYATRG